MKKFKRFFGILCACCMLTALIVPATAVDSPEPSGFSLVASGTLSSGTEYWVYSLTEEQGRKMGAKKDYVWDDLVTVPVSNSDGTNGNQLGKDFITGRHTYCNVYVGRLPNRQADSVEVAFEADGGAAREVVSHVTSQCIVSFKPASQEDNARILVSTKGDKAMYVNFKMGMSETLPTAAQDKTAAADQADTAEIRFTTTAPSYTTEPFTCDGEVRYQFKNAGSACTVSLMKQGLFGRYTEVSSFEAASSGGGEAVYSSSSRGVYQIRITSSAGIGSGVNGTLRVNQNG